VATTQDSTASTARARSRQAELERRERRKRFIAIGLAVLITAFALLNLDDVRVHWLLFTSQTPLIIVIALALLVGMALDRLIIKRRSRRTPTVER
jgi:uncharacterized integral membrane protein